MENTTDERGPRSFFGKFAQGHSKAISFVVLAVMLAMIGEYVAGLTRRLRDRPAYYVREEHTSSVLLREERTNVVSTADGR